MPLSKKQIKHLKALAHSKKPVVTVGQNGLSNPVLEEIRLALDHHELIKIKLPAAEKNERQQLAEEICEQCGAHFVTMIGRVAVVFLASPDSSIELPT